jgi:hypothetical protein
MLETCVIFGKPVMRCVAVYQEYTIISDRPSNFKSWTPRRELEEFDGGAT